MSMAKDTLAKRLTEARKSRGLSRERLAVAAGLSSSTILRLENGIEGSPRLATLEEIAKVLDTTVGDLIGATA